MKRLFIAIAICCISAPAFAHIEVSNPTARSTNGQEQKQSPCGGVTRTNTPTVLDAGSTINVDWIETIDHTGFYRISFMMDGQSFPLIDSADDPDLTGQPCMALNDTPIDGCTVLADKIPEDPNMTYSIPVTLPAQNCDNCTLQVIQVMRSAGQVAPSNLYFRCSDIQLVNGTDPPDMGGGMPDMGTGEMDMGAANNANNVNNVNNANNVNNVNNVNPNNANNANNNNGTDGDTTNSINGEGGCATATPANPLLALLFVALIAIRRRD